MKTYFTAKAITIVYNGLEADGSVFARKSCKIKTPIMAKALDARVEVLAQIDALARQYDVPEGGIKILNLEVLPISVYENAEEEAHKQTSVKVCKLGLLRELKEGQEIKPSVNKYWRLNEDGNVEAVYYFDIKEGDINPFYEDEQDTSKWYFVNKKYCLFTGNDKCKKHFSTHESVWFKFIKNKGGNENVTK